MSKPFVVSIPHRLGREEATRRIKSGMANVRSNYSVILAIHEESWTDHRLTFTARSLGQSAAGIIDIAEDHVRLELTLPWLLEKLAERFVPAVSREVRLLLEKKKN